MAHFKQVFIFREVNSYTMYESQEKPYQITSEKSDALSRNKTHDTPVLWWGALD